VIKQVWRGGRAFEYGAARSERSLENDECACRVDGIVERANNVSVPNLGAGNLVAQCTTCSRQCRKIEMLSDDPEQGANAAGKMEVLHQIFARGHEIADNRHAFTGGAEIG